MKKYLLKPDKAFIRIAPCGDQPWEDYSYTTEPLIFKRKTSSGDLIFTYAPDTLSGRMYRNQEIILDEMWDDGNWIPFGILDQMEKTSLYKYKGKYVMRCKPCTLPSGFKDSSYTSEAVKLITATKYHVVIYDSFLKKNMILDCRYTNPNEWRVLS